jgi:hypothetical protein
MMPTPLPRRRLSATRALFAPPVLARVAALCALGALPLLAGCKKATEPAVAATLTIAQGNQQAAPAGRELPVPIMLRVRSSTGQPMKGVPVSFTVVAGGGSVDPATVLSDANGEARSKWTLGAAAVLQTLVGAVNGVEPVTILANAILPTELLIVQGNAQSARIGTALTTPIVVRVVGPNNVPIPGLTIGFQILSGSGSITPQSAVTNNLGEVTARWTLGAQPGTQQAQVVGGPLLPIGIQATAVP